MNREELIAQIFKKKSFLCVGLDPDLSKIPPFLLELEDPVFEFNKRIIIVASPAVQKNFKMQLFDERKLRVLKLSLFFSFLVRIPKGIFENNLLGIKINLSTSDWFNSSSNGWTKMSYSLFVEL